jgi:hypothetical protein
MILDAWLDIQPKDITAGVIEWADSTVKRSTLNVEVAQVRRKRCQGRMALT